ncbi:MAG: hypothetical protein U0W24_20465 [Bacteroidales bacterium]
MKKNLILCSFIILLSSASSLAQTDWGYWYETDCSKGLEFRVKRLECNQHEKKYKWAVQFRNKYQHDIHFNCIAVEPQREREIKALGKASDRFHVERLTKMVMHGFRLIRRNDEYDDFNSLAFCLSSTETQKSGACAWYLYSHKNRSHGYQLCKELGLSVICIKE